MSDHEETDRNTTTPFLLKLFYKRGSHNHVDDFHPTELNAPHVQIYTWPSATIDELAHLVSDNLPQTLPEPAIGTRLDFELVFPDVHSPLRSDGYERFKKRPLGSIVIGGGGPGGVQTNGVDHVESLLPSTGDEGKTLLDAKFVIGYYIDCAIFPPLANGDVAPGPRNYTARNGPRENGFGGLPYSGGRRGGGRGGGLPAGEWTRGDRVPVPSGGGGGYGRRGSRGRGW